MTKRVSDGYDYQIERLKKSLDFIREWSSSIGLFRMCDNVASGDPGPIGIGCLTMVKTPNSSYRACTLKITEAIKSDERLPSEIGGINPENLPVFAEWQRKLDKKLKREPYVDKDQPA